ncbi:MAG: DNA polymerase III subunit delta [bacterium]
MSAGTPYGQYNLDNLKELPPVFFACGPEELLKDEFVAELEEQFPSKERERVKVYADEADSGDLTQELRGRGLFSAEKWVILKRLGQKEGGRTHLNRLYGEIEDYLEDPAPDATLIMMDSDHPYQSGRKTGSLARLVENSGGDSIIFWSPFKKELHKRVRDECRQHDVDMNPEALDMLVDKVRGKFSRIQKELQKLIQDTEPGGRITLEAVEEIVSEESSEDPFQSLKNALFSNEFTDVFKELDDLYRQGNVPPRIFYVVSRYLVNLRGIKRNLNEGDSLEGTLKQRGIPTSNRIQKQFRQALKSMRQEYPKDFFRNSYVAMKGTKYGKDPFNQFYLERYLLRTIPRLRSY